jgi:hypothetical protein
MKDLTPSREEVARRIEMLRDGRITRQEISAWASEIAMDDKYDFEDKVLFDIMTSLSAVDTPTTDRDYLYQDIDFESWINEILPTASFTK